MEYRTVEVTLQHAEDLYRAAYFYKIAVYGVVSLSNNHDGSRHKFKSPVDRDGHTGPTWNFPTKFQVSEAAVSADSLTLRLHLFWQRSFFDDSPLGHVDVSIKHLLHHSAAETAASADGWRGMSRPVSHLNFSFKLSEIINPAAPPPVPAKDWASTFKVVAEAAREITQAVAGAIEGKGIKPSNPEAVKVETPSTSAGIRMGGIPLETVKAVQDYLIKNPSSLNTMRNIKRR